MLMACGIMLSLAVPVAASNMSPSYINQSGDFVGGEPGEDPHLRLPVIVKMRDDGLLSAPTGVTDRSPDPIESFGGECFGEDSRVRDVWELVLHMLYDVLPR